jgi:hypothetical protein
VTNPQKAKGDKAELEIARILHGELGLPVRRKLGAGRSDDAGDDAEWRRLEGQADIADARRDHGEGRG